MDRKRSEKTKEEVKCYGLPLFTLAAIDGREATASACWEETHGHRLPLIESTRCLIPPKRGLLPGREPEFGGESSAAEKPIFASLLARAICCDRSRCCCTFGGTRSTSFRAGGTPRGSGDPWNDRLVRTYSSGGAV